ncbi:hypothetical protein CVT26_005582 [Gymnopilus dilepis]|uniref:Asl1-like glycosyl hydrolase catalytic domain-containing protein n=1 Tax=Gymnopilus dilepis TaxID=231916 RepID=A0A409XZV5_9AGAR|nr:hypothetical protein CVT26_005582 [Gymnopilus dilepis]
MIALRIVRVFLVAALAGHVGANHIKRGHARHRSQCRPRLLPSTEDGAAHYSVICAHSSSISSARLAAPSTSKPISTSTNQATQPTTTLSVSAPSTSSVPQSISPSSGVESFESLSALLTPNRIKAGIAGGDAYPFMKNHIGWWYDWSPNPSKPGSPIAVPMLWGDGTVDAQDAARLKAFERLSSVPSYVLGFEEPDCPPGEGSAGMSVSDGVSKWESLIAPLKAKGTKLGSPSMCKQADETWLAQFKKQISTPWDFTAIHINKNNLDGVKKDIEHYMTYGKPIWVTEFACVNDSNQFTPCTNQAEIDNFINEVVPYFESNPNIFAYAYSNGEGLGDVWPLMKGNSLSDSGKTYLAAISKYH